MTTYALNDLELATPTVVKQSARDFAVALVGTPEFQAFEEAAERMRQDEPAQQAMEAYQAKHQSLQALLLLNAVSEDEQAELERLRQAFFSDPSVIAYLQAEAALRAVCQATADLISQDIGLNYAAVCGYQCCG
jgi:cell fate (sporulation/competence/biofilm development) regulator YlbF (YheA/YmcA/DUF963 family)